MKSICITDNNKLRNLQVNCNNDFKSVILKSSGPEESFFNANNTVKVLNCNSLFLERNERHTFDCDISANSLSINVRNKVGTGVAISIDSRLVIDKRLDTSNYRALDNIDKAPSAKVEKNSIGFDSINTTVVGNANPLLHSEYKRDKNTITGIILECQSANYIEFTPIIEGRIVGVIGLPSGVKFEYGKIKGSPTKAGEYKGLITLENGNTISLLIKVSRIRRVF